VVRFLKWFVVFGALGCIAMFFFYTLIIITMYNFHLLLLVMVMGVAMILAIVFAIIEKLDANIHKLEQMIKEQRESLAQEPQNSIIKNLKCDLLKNPEVN